LGLNIEGHNIIKGCGLSGLCVRKLLRKLILTQRAQRAQRIIDIKVKYLMTNEK
jgi:hypothetical protein